MRRAVFFLFIVAAACQAQQPAGLENPWDVQTILKKINQDNADLKTLLDGLKPQQWVSQKGAPTTYVLQWQSTEQQLHDISVSSDQLAHKTDSLPLALDNYFRLEALDVTARNIEQGARRYADRASADKLTELIARNFNDRERFRQYLQDLATSFEQTCKIADEEAQRCRGIISKEPASSARKSHK
ncbi:MAG TPA: hypothetical protein VHZ55_03140 [Bryobacteraceae bacterium]|nr:hypothetical protein [Bryobacteraceae bacterium]